VGGLFIHSVLYFTFGQNFGTAMPCGTFLSWREASVTSSEYYFTSYPAHSLKKPKLIRKKSAALIDSSIPTITSPFRSFRLREDPCENFHPYFSRLHNDQYLPFFESLSLIGSVPDKNIGENLEGLCIRRSILKDLDDKIVDANLKKIGLAVVSTRCVM
jgi:hypothetical protein